MYALKISLGNMPEKGAMFANNYTFALKIQLLQPGHVYTLQEVINTLKMYFMPYSDQTFHIRPYDIDSLMVTAKTLFSSATNVKGYIQQLAQRGVIDPADVIAFENTVNLYKKEYTDVNFADQASYAQGLHWFYESMKKCEEGISSEHNSQSTYQPPSLTLK